MLEPAKIRLSDMIANTTPAQAVRYYQEMRDNFDNLLATFTRTGTEADRIAVAFAADVLAGATKVMSFHLQNASLEDAQDATAPSMFFSREG